MACYGVMAMIFVQAKRFPSNTQVRRGTRMVHGSKELVENDLCPRGSGNRFRKCRHTGCF
jgi:hypothetical protein